MSILKQASTRPACSPSNHHLQESSRLYAQVRKLEVRIQTLEQELATAMAQLADMSKLRCDTQHQACVVR
jgi:hypothetical protein